MKDSWVERNDPFFSVIVPVYNKDKFISRCIDSILNQSFTSFEIIIVDDGSTDQSRVICENYARKFKHIRVIRQSNKGLLLARRAGLKIAKGEYIIHIDSDDMVFPNLLFTLKKYIDKFQVKLIVYNHVFIDDNDYVIKEGKAICSEKFALISRNEFIFLNFKNYFLNGIVFKCAKRTIVDFECDYSIYGKLNMGEDLLQSCALLENISDVLYINEHLYMYRYNVDGISKTFNLHYIENFLNVRKRVLEMLCRCNGEKEIFELFYQNYIHDFNIYIIKALMHIKTINMFMKFREDILKKEILLNKQFRYPLRDLILYMICKSHFCILIKPIFVFFYKCKLKI